MPNNLDSELNEIVDVLAHQVYLSAHAPGYTKLAPQNQKYLKEAKQAILALIAKADKEARIDEVNRLSRYVELRHTADGATISAHYLYRQARKRINELKEE